MRPVLELNEGFSRKLFYLMSDDTSLSLSLSAPLYGPLGRPEGGLGRERLEKRPF